MKLLIIKSEPSAEGREKKSQKSFNSSIKTKITILFIPWLKQKN